MTMRLIPQLLLVTGCLNLPAQTAGPTPVPAFDVASITPSATARRGGEGRGREHISWNPKGVTLDNASLTNAIEWAYQVKFYQVSAPAWASGDRYEILARCQNPASLERLRGMLQALLAGRFGLALHREAKVMAVYELRPDRGGPRLAPARAGEDTDLRVVNRRFILQAMSMGEFAGWLSDLAVVDRPVLDRTGVAGAYDFTLPAIPYPAPEGVDPAWIFTALRSELGLALRPAKAPVEILVVDRAEKPSPN